MISIASFNCKGFKERNFDYLKELYDKVDIMMIQETWLYSFEDNIINKIFNGCNNYSVSAMNDSDIGRKGRPYGGCSIVWKNSLAIKVSPINTISNRICAVCIECDADNLLLINVYMPTIDSSVDNLNEYSDVLGELSSLIQTFNDSKILIGGDFNIDFERDVRTRFYGVLSDFLVEESLMTHDESVPLTSPYFTFQSYNGSTLSIDHFIYCENLYENVFDFEVFLDGNNLSDHFPIIIKYDLKNKFILDSNDEGDNNVNSCNWAGVTTTDIDLYKLVLDTFLDNVYLPESVINCTDLFCKEHTPIILNYFNEIIDAIKIATEITIPKHKKHKSKGIVGWNKYVKFFKDKSIYWTNIWR